MGMRALSIAATGGRALMSTIDTIANNLANVNTTGFKRTRANFADLFYQTIQRAGFGTEAQNQHPTGTAFGTGVRLVSTEKMMEQGAPDRTERDLDWMIEGEGFFRVRLPNDTIAFRRAGNWNVDSDGNIVTPEGYLLDPQITVPENIIRIFIDQTGLIQGFDPDNPENLQAIGQIMLTRFVNPSGLEAVGESLYIMTPAAGDEFEGTPGTGQGFGKIRQGYLEESNVDVIKELVDLIRAQRAFEINGNSIEVADEVLQNINALRR
ncbi:MAG: flagellar basal-body rod protein FlgG [Planctomycetota bacterium]|jgi:flagellar basal-body rod protein FlgG